MSASPVCSSSNVPSELPVQNQARNVVYVFDVSVFFSLDICSDRYSCSGESRDVSDDMCPEVDQYFLDKLEDNLTSLSLPSPVKYQAHELNFSERKLTVYLQGVSEENKDDVAARLKGAIEVCHSQEEEIDCDIVYIHRIRVGGHSANYV